MPDTLRIEPSFLHTTSLPAYTFGTSEAKAMLSIRTSAGAALALGRAGAGTQQLRHAVQALALTHLFEPGNRQSASRTWGRWRASEVRWTRREGGADGAAIGIAPSVKCSPSWPLPRSSRSRWSGVRTAGPRVPGFTVPPVPPDRERTAGPRVPGFTVPPRHRPDRTADRPDRDHGPGPWMWRRRWRPRSAASRTSSAPSSKMAAAQSGDLAERARTVGEAKVLAARVQGDGKSLRDLADKLRDRLGRGVVALGAEQDGKAILLVAVTKDLTVKLKAGDLVKAGAKLVGGSGGGKPEMAQAGGPDPAGIEKALAEIEDLAARALA